MYYEKYNKPLPMEQSSFIIPQMTKEGTWGIHNWD